MLNEKTSKDVGFFGFGSVCVILYDFVFLLFQTLYVSHPKTLTWSNLRLNATAAAIIPPGIVSTLSSGVTCKLCSKLSGIDFCDVSDKEDYEDG